MTRWLAASLLILAIAGFFATFLAGVNSERLNTSTDIVTSGQYATFVGLPILGALTAAIARFCVRLKANVGRLNAAATPKHQTTLGMIGKELDRLASQGDLAEARVLLDAAEKVKGAG